MEDGRLIMDPNSEYKLAQVHPWLAHLIRELHDRLFREGINIRVTQGLRSWVDQEHLYAQGRTAPGPIVTKAAPGFSQHCYGLAVDVVPLDAHNNPDWNKDHPSWKRIVEVGESLGLRAGAEFRTFPDFPHFELTGKWPSVPSDEEKQTYFRDGTQGVWAKADLCQS